eukprot:Rhum_TRINITY_DN9530_c0_g1::Rhum_TRINITY_DN9530_c0_g1_i1::g.33766::m.33766
MGGERGEVRGKRGGEGLRNHCPHSLCPIPPAPAYTTKFFFCCSLLSRHDKKCHRLFPHPHHPRAYPSSSPPHHGLFFFGLFATKNIHCPMSASPLLAEYELLSAVCLGTVPDGVGSKPFSQTLEMSAMMARTGPHIETVYRSLANTALPCLQTALTLALLSVHILMPQVQRLRRLHLGAAPALHVNRRAARRERGHPGEGAILHETRRRAAEVRRQQQVVVRDDPLRTPPRVLHWVKQLRQRADAEGRRRSRLHVAHVQQCVDQSHEHTGRVHGGAAAAAAAAAAADDPSRRVGGGGRPRPTLFLLVPPRDGESVRVVAQHAVLGREAAHGPLVPVPVEQLRRRRLLEHRRLATQPRQRHHKPHRCSRRRRSGRRRLRRALLRSTSLGVCRGGCGRGSGSGSGRRVSLRYPRATRRRRRAGRRFCRGSRRLRTGVVCRRRRRGRGVVRGGRSLG